MHCFVKAALAVSALCASLGAFAQTTAPGPYYATPSWDQTLPAASRFIVLSNFANSAVLDRETGLVWWRTPGNPDDPARLRVPFGSAQFVCLTSRIGGRRGWRLPTADELLSLFDPATTMPPFLPAGHPFNFGSAELFWSSTATPSNPGSYVVVTYGLGGSPLAAQSTYIAPQVDNSLNTAGIICVRGAN
jgi:hypothetical protein